MKRAFGLIAATLLTTSIYSQDYSSSSSTQNPDSTPPDYQSRQSEAGAPTTSESGSSSTSGYELSPGTSGGNSSTGQSNGANIGSAVDQDQTLTTRDSDLSGSEYRGTLEDEAQRSSESDSSSETDVSEPLRGTGTVDGAFHEPAAPVREGSESEGWSGAGTFSGAGPGSVSESASSSESSSSTPYPVESGRFNAEVTGNEALSNRDQNLIDRGLEPDGDQLNQLNREDAFSNRVEGDLDQDQVLIFEDWTIVEPDTSVGGPAQAESGSGSSGTRMSKPDSYSRDLYLRVQRDWSGRLGNMDVPATPEFERMMPGVMDHEVDHLRIFNNETLPNVGGPARSESGTKSSDDDIECDKRKDSGAPAGFESDSDYKINRGDDEKYHINREAESSAPGEYGDRATKENYEYDDGHLSGNNAAGSSGSSESSTSSSEESVVTPPDL